MYWYKWIVMTQFIVPGPCLLALVWHQWMLGHAHAGLDTKIFLLNMLECVHCLFVKDVNVNWCYECIHLFVPICNHCSGWIVAPHYGVLGPCLMALDWHCMMLGYALDGLGDCSCFDSCVAHCSVTLSSLNLRTLVIYIGTFFIAANSETVLPLFYKIAHPCREFFLSASVASVVRYRDYFLSYSRK